jgi:hypothetical protein
MKIPSCSNLATLLVALLTPALCQGAGNRNPQLDLWYDLEIVTDHSAIYSTVDSYRGDFHLVVPSSRKSNSRKLILKLGEPNGTWPGGTQIFLESYVRTPSPARIESVKLVDKQGKVSALQLNIDISNTEWTLCRVPLNSFPSAISLIELVFSAGDEVIELDDIKLTQGKGVVTHVTDKPLRQRISETSTSRQARIDVAFAAVALENAHDSLSNSYFARLWTADNDEKLKLVNADLYRLYTSEGSEEWHRRGLGAHWNLSVTHFLLRCYNTFSARAEGDKKGRLEKQTEDALLKVLWDRTIHENEIYITSNSTLAMDGSENHDLDSKVASLLASKVFMDHPEWAKKILPNAGKGSGSGYWFHADGDNSVYGPEGLADWRGQDTNKYTPKDHYVEWVRYFHRFVEDRAKSGFFLEKASGHYMTYTMGYLFDMHKWCGDESLKKTTGNLLDVIWTEWAIDQLHGVRGGAKTRYRFQPNATPEGLRDAFSEIGQFFFGGAGKAQHNAFSILLSDYEMPEHVWKLAFDRKSLGSYTYAIRALGESPGDYIGVPGQERTLVCKPTSRLIRYSWVTPDYILGTQMDHPGAIHNHLSVSGRFQGLFFAEPRGASVYVKGIQNEQEFTTRGSNYPYNNTMVRSVQHEQVAIFQGARRVLRQSPAWFPNEAHELDGMIVGFARVQHVEEDKGWIFVQNGEGLLAIRVVDGVQKPMANGANAANRGVVDYPLESEYVDLVEEGYVWNEFRDKLKFDDPWSPVIFEAGRLDDFGSMNAFKQYILSNKVTLLKTVVPGFYRLRYEYGKDKATRIDFNAANLQIPRINGIPIDYDPPYLFKSPYLNSEYQTGKIRIQNNSEALDYNF